MAVGLAGATSSDVAYEAPVAWAAIFVGAVVGLAAALVLTLAGAGLGLTLSFGGVGTRQTLAAFTPVLGAEAIVVQVLAAGIGGYLAGRLRHQWSSAHADEAHFRDMAHGVAAWALSTIAGVILAAALLGPYADQLSAASAAPAVDPQRAASLVAQSSLFAAIGMLLAGFIAAVTGRIGGMRTEEMHAAARG